MNLMNNKYLIIILIFLLAFIPITSCANIIENITENIGNDKIIYPIREQTLIILLQPILDNSNDYTMTLCNRRMICVQTSMRNDEIRYMGPFLESSISYILNELKNETNSINTWNKRQDFFRNVYVNYMNIYDKKFGTLNSININSK